MGVIGVLKGPVVFNFVLFIALRNLFPAELLFSIITCNAIVWLFYIVTNPKRKKDTKRYSIVVDEKERIRRAPESPDELYDYIPGSPEFKTVYDTFKGMAERYPNNPCYGWRPPQPDGNGVGDFEWLTYAESLKLAVEFGSGLVGMNLIPKNDDGMKLIALYSESRTEWILSMHATFCHGGSIVPIYATLAGNELVYVLNQTEVTTIVCSADKIDKIIACKKDFISLKTIIVMDLCQKPELSNDLRKLVASAGLTILMWTDVVQYGKQHSESLSIPKGKDIAVFCYTSGTTGHAKGALLTHTNFIAAAGSTRLRCIVANPSDVYLSYLPLAHVLELAVQMCILASGGRIGFYQGDTLKIAEDLKVLRPTIFVSVPRLLNRMHSKVISGASSSPLKKVIFNLGLIVKRAKLISTGIPKHAFFDRIVFSKIAKKIGLDRCRLVITGSAPIRPEVFSFLKVVLGCDVVVGYGQSETSAAATISDPKDALGGHVGGPSPTTEIKLVDVPDMNYLFPDTCHGTGDEAIKCEGRGEVCFRGPTCFHSYYKMAEKTAETIDSNGWVYSGDIGIWLPGGQLQLVDRKSNMFKLAQGEFVTPERIENVYTNCELVTQSFVYGHPLKHFLVAIVVPDYEFIAKMVHGASGKSPDEISRDAEIASTILKAMTETGRAAGLKGFELVKVIHLEVDPFSVENGLLTPSFKVKRHVIKVHYEKEIQEMYNLLQG
eukprot:428269_1